MHQSSTSSLNQQVQDDQSIVIKLIYLYLMVESSNEKERLKFSDMKDFYSEIAFQFLKNYEKPVAANSSLKKGALNFFDFSSPPEHVQYNFINKLKSGHILPQKIVQFMKYRGIECTESEINSIFKTFNQESNSPGLNYESFLKIILPQSIPQMRSEIQKRKVIYETKGLNEQLSMKFQDVIFEIFQLELNLLRISEKQKLKLINEYKWDMVKSFELLDNGQNGYLNYENIDIAIRSIGKSFVPRDYLCLLKRMNKSEGEDTISFQNFKELLSPNLPYFKDEEGGNKAQLHCGSQRSLDETQNISRLFQESSRSTIKPRLENSYLQKEKELYFVDSKGRIVDQAHPEMQRYIKRMPELQEALNQNRTIKASVQNRDNTYHLLPDTEYNSKHFEIMSNQQRQLISKNFQGQQGTALKNQSQQQQTQLQQKTVQFQNTAQIQQQNQQQRKSLFDMKDTVMNGFNHSLQREASDNIPFMRDVYRASQYQSSRKEMLPMQYSSLYPSAGQSHINSTYNLQQQQLQHPTNSVYKAEPVQAVSIVRPVQQQQQFQSQIQQQQFQQYNQQAQPHSTNNVQQHQLLPFSNSNQAIINQGNQFVNYSDQVRQAAQNIATKLQGNNKNQINQQTPLQSQQQQLRHMQQQPGNRQKIFQNNNNDNNMLYSDTYQLNNNQQQQYSQFQQLQQQQSQYENNNNNPYMASYRAGIEPLPAKAPQPQ